jgi:hypothetical protein
MTMTLEEWKTFMDVAQATTTVLSLLIGGIWVYRTYVRQQLHRPNIEFEADIKVIAQQGQWWVVELQALVENKGKVQHRMEDLSFDANGLSLDDDVQPDSRWGGQINFPQRVAKGSFLPAHCGFFFVDPGVKAKYSYLTRVSTDIHILNLHCWFRYPDTILARFFRQRFGHSAETTRVLELENVTTIASSGRPAA